MIWSAPRRGSLSGKTLPCARGSGRGRSIAVTVTGDRVTIHGKERGPHQHERALLLAQWAVGPYVAEVVLSEPVNGALTNATYGNGVLVLAMPKMARGQHGVPAEIRLEAVEATRGERVGHVSRMVRPTTTEEHLRQHQHRIAQA